MIYNSKIGFGGGCHWCTEAVFQSLKGVLSVEQGFIASIGENSSFSEAVIVSYNSTIIELKVLIEIHLHTHNSTSNHRFRKKYRSAVYYFEKRQKPILENYINELQVDFDNKLITQILQFQRFESSRPEFINYYLSNPKKPFCERYIHPKLQLLRKKYTDKIL